MRSKNVWVKVANLETVVLSICTSCNCFFLFSDGNINLKKLIKSSISSLCDETSWPICSDVIDPFRVEINLGTA